MLNYSATGLPAGLSYANGIISGTIANDAAGSYTVTLTASDPTANGTATATATFTWTVTPPIVTLTNPGDQTSLAGFAGVRLRHRLEQRRRDGHLQRERSAAGLKLYQRRDLRHHR